MYNEERKMRFLAETRESSAYGISVFKTFEPYEREAGMDLCELTTEALQPVINTNFGFRERTIETAISFMRSYVAWCRERDCPTSDGVYGLRTEMDEKMKRLMIASPAHLESILNKAFAPVSKETIDCLYRCYLWMVFAGMEESDPLDVTVDEIDFSYMTIEHGGRSYEIYREAVPAFRMACDATQFLYINPNYTGDKEKGVYRDRYPGKSLFRGIRSDQIKLTTIKGIINKAFSTNGIETSFGKVRLSGLFYKTFEMERMGEPVNFNSYVVECMNKTDSQYHRNYTRSKRANSIRRYIKNDYEHWKAAFIK